MSDLLYLDRTQRRPEHRRGAYFAGDVVLSTPVQPERARPVVDNVDDLDDPRYLRPINPTRAAALGVVRSRLLVRPVHFRSLTPYQIRTHDGPSRPLIKGNADSKLFHAPGSRSYDRTHAEVLFWTTEEAIEAGYKPAYGGSANAAAD